MKINLQLNTNDAPLPVGIESLQSFIKVAEIGTYAVDDLTLSVHNGRNKVYVVRVDADKRADLFKCVERYASLKGIKYWVDNAVPENQKPNLYFSVYRTKDGWMFDYGVTSGLDLYVVGRFKFGVTVLETLPPSKILKDFKSDFESIDLRTHTLLDVIRRDLIYVDLGPCKITNPQIVGDTVTVSTHNLGVWHQVGKEMVWAQGEAQKYLLVFQKWVKQRKWWPMIQIKVRPYDNGWVDFSISPKK